MENSRNKLSIDVTEFVQQLLARVLASAPVTQDRPLRVCVAYSGGLDSTVLLHALHRAARANPSTLDLVALHVHHGLSPNADAWAEHCRQRCASWGIRFDCRYVSVDRVSGTGLEAAARSARYQAYAEASSDLVVLGHHLDDQAETLLLNLLRGSSVLGAAAMPELRERFVRPLLNVPRSRIRSYAEACALSWIEDESNEDLRFSRNYLRKEILPSLSLRFPAAAANLAQAAVNFADAQLLMDELAVLDGAAQCPLPLNALRKKNQARALNVLTYHLRSAAIRIPSRRWLLELLRQLLGAVEDRQIKIQTDGLAIRRHRDCLIIDTPVDIGLSPLPWAGDVGELPWGRGQIRANRTLGKGIAKARLGRRLELRPRQGGERLEVRPGLRRSVKDLMREACIPPWLRHRLPLLFSDGELVWIPSVGIAEKYRCGPEEDGISLEFDEASW